MDGHLLLIDTLVGTFRTLPIVEDPWGALARLRIDLLASEVFRLALVIALPATMLMLFVNLVLGFTSRVAPQLNIFAVGFPVTLLAGLLALALGAQHMMEPLTEALRVFLAPLR